MIYCALAIFIPIVVYIELMRKKHNETICRKIKSLQRSTNFEHLQGLASKIAKEQEKKDSKKISAVILESRKNI